MSADIETVRVALSELSPENPWAADDALSALARIEALLAETEARAVRAEAERDEALRKLECKWGACKNCGGQVWQVWLDEPVLAGQEGKT